MLEHGTPRVWIVDDSPLDATMQAESLRGLDVQTFSNASAFLERVMFDTPDVAVPDIVLPDMSGLDVCRYLRATFDQTQVPVIMVSARTDEDAVLEAFEAGANDHVGKPFARGCCAPASKRWSRSEPCAASWTTSCAPARRRCV